jgi:hypothetical protein
VTNGARGEIVGIILHPDEKGLLEGLNMGVSIIRLTHMALYLLVKLKKMRAAQLEGLEPEVVPVEPTPQDIQISVRLRGSKYVKRTIKRRQLPITTAYAFKFH